APATASLIVRAGWPAGTPMPNFASSCLAWYSWMFIGNPPCRSCGGHKHSVRHLANASRRRQLAAMIDRARLEDICREAGAMALRQWPGNGHALESWEKGPGSPVCTADLEVDGFLRRELGRLLPAAGWLS